MNLGRVSVTVRSNVTALNTTPLDQREKEKSSSIHIDIVKFNNKAYKKFNWTF